MEVHRNYHRSNVQRYRCARRVDRGTYAQFTPIERDADYRMIRIKAVSESRTTPFEGRLGDAEHVEML